MTVPFRHLLVLLVFAADLAALLTVLAGPLPRHMKAKWCAIIVLLPFLGVGLWLRRNGDHPDDRFSRSASRDRSRGPTH